MKAIYFAAFAILAAAPALAQEEHISNTTSGVVTPSSGRTNNGTMGASSDASWNEQNSYWRGQYPSQPYYNSTTSYSSYEPAYRYGVDTYNQHPGKRYEELSDGDLEKGWVEAHGDSPLDWKSAQVATKDAYNRAYQTGQSNSTH